MNIKLILIALSTTFAVSAPLTAQGSDNMQIGGYGYKGETTIKAHQGKIIADEQERLKSDLANGLYAANMDIPIHAHQRNNERLQRDGRGNRQGAISNADLNEDMLEKYVETRTQVKSALNEYAEKHSNANDNDQRNNLLAEVQIEIIDAFRENEISMHEYRSILNASQDDAAIKRRIDQFENNGVRRTE